MTKYNGQRCDGGCEVWRLEENCIFSKASAQINYFFRLRNTERNISFEMEFRFFWKQEKNPTFLKQKIIGSTTHTYIYPSIHWDHTLYRASVLPKQSPGLMGTILEGSSLQHWILKWLNHPNKLVLILPTTEGWQAESTHLVLIQRKSRIWTQDPRIPNPPP